MNLRHLSAGVAVLLAFSGPAVAQQAGGTLLHALAGCAGLSDGAARLACYDRLAPQVNAALTAGAPAVQSAPAVAAAPPSAPQAPAAPAVAATQPPAPKDQSSWFGFDMGDLFGSSPKAQTTPAQFGADQLPQKPQQQASAQPREIDSITAGLTEYAKTPFGKFIVFLDNGQIWRQLQGDGTVAYFPHKLKGVSVEISRGLLGSYNMHLVGSARTYKVERVK
ncbi:MAG: hypothetical protein KGQ94_08260 [Alphaproteobacteria bacterium]|nr:hypothetical protein [Alphaproteobacteria bacterium]